MDSDKDINSSRRGPITDRRRNSDRFFKKFEPRPPVEAEASNVSLFQEPAPADVEIPEPVINQPPHDELARVISPEPLESNSPAQSAKRSPTLVWGGLICITLVSLLLMVWQTIRQEKVRHVSKPDVNTSPDLQGNTDGGESAVATPGPPEVSTTESPNVVAKSRTRIYPLSQSARSSVYPFLLNNMLRQAREFENRGMLNQAALEYRSILIKFPNDRDSQSGLERIETLISKQRRNDMSRVSREAGLNEFRFGNYAKAEGHLLAAVAEGRIDVPTLYALGMTHIKLGHYSKAQIVLNRCLAASPNYAPALVGLAQAHIAIGEKGRALQLLNRALELGGGAEFTPVKIEEMISSIVIAKGVTKP